MSTYEAGGQVLYIPADEKRLTGAQDVYQTAARLRPLLRSTFKTGGILDELNLGNPTIEDHDSFTCAQTVAGTEIEQLFASRSEGRAYVAAEMGYLRHLPNFSRNIDSRLAIIVSAAREIALASSIYLDLPRVPTVTFDPLAAPQPDNTLYVGTMEYFKAKTEAIQPLGTYKGDDSVVQPLLLWKIDPYPSYWSDNANTPSCRQPLYQGDILISTDMGAAPSSSTAQTYVFVQSHSEEYRSLVRDQMLQR